MLLKALEEEKILAAPPELQFYDGKPSCSTVILTQWANSCSPIVLYRTVSALYVMSEEGKPLIEDMYHLSQPRKP